MKTDIVLGCNPQWKILFDSGKMSTDGGLFPIKDFMDKSGMSEYIRNNFKTAGSENNYYTDYEILLEVLFQIMAGYNTDDCADFLRYDPTFTSIIGKSSVPSQPTLHRFYDRMNDTTLAQLKNIMCGCRKLAYSIEMPSQIVIDIDSTMLEAYGQQEGRDLNGHYGAFGFHPILYFDRITGDLLAIKLRIGNVYTSDGVVGVLQPLLDVYKKEYPGITRYLCGDSGFAVPELYKQCEENEVFYVIRLKKNKALKKKASYLVDSLLEQKAKDYETHFIAYGSFEYQADSWDKPRRVVAKVEIPSREYFPVYSFFVTNMDSTPEEIVSFYCKRGNMENFIKEVKNNFYFGDMCSHSMITNSNRLQIHALAYSIFNYFKRLVLPKNMRNQTVETIRNNLLKCALKVTRTGRSVFYHLCSSFAHQSAFRTVVDNINRLAPSLSPS